MANAFAMVDIQPSPGLMHVTRSKTGGGGVLTSTSVPSATEREAPGNCGGIWVKCRRASLQPNTRGKSCFSGAGDSASGVEFKYMLQVSCLVRGSFVVVAVDGFHM